MPISTAGMATPRNMMRQPAMSKAPWAISSSEATGAPITVVNGWKT